MTGSIDAEPLPADPCSSMSGRMIFFGWLLGGAGYTRCLDRPPGAPPPKWESMMPRLQEQVVAPLMEAEDNAVALFKRRAEVGEAAEVVLCCVVSDANFELMCLLDYTLNKSTAARVQNSTILSKTLIIIIIFISEDDISRFDIFSPTTGGCSEGLGSL